MVAPPVAGSSSVVMLPELRILPCSMQRIWTAEERKLGISDGNMRSWNASTEGERPGVRLGIKMMNLAGHNQAFVVCSDLASLLRENMA